MKVKEQLKLIGKDQKVDCVLYAYGIFYASSWKDGMETAEDCLNNMNSACINAKVLKLNTSNADPGRLVVHAEIV